MVNGGIGMKWAVDEIIDNIVVIENIDSGIKKEVDIRLLPSSIYEGAILSYDGKTFVLDESEEDKRRRIIMEKFKRLRSDH